MGEPIGYLLTWRTHGSWLHGDVRGSVDREHNAYGTPTLDPNPERERWESRQLKTPAVALDDAQRKIVADAIQEHCRVVEWPLLELAVRTNHVHIVVEYCGTPPDRVMSALKAWATRRLREAKRAESTARIWATGGSTKYLWNAAGLNGAVAYVREGQDVPH